jgi:hypothetical protein
MKRLGATSLALWLLGCGDPLVDPQTVEGLRIVGARVHAESDAARANLLPGETATIQWLILAERPRTYTGLALWCKAKPSAFGVPPCEKAFERQTFEGTSETPVTLTFTIPNSHDTQNEWVNVVGLCERGEPTWNSDEQRFGCSKGESLSGVYVGGAKANQNPSLQDDVLTIDGESWLPPNVDEELACGSPNVPDIAATDEVTIRLRGRGNDRETLEGAEFAAAARETLTYTHVATWPGLERAYSAVEGDAKDALVEVTFQNEGDLDGSRGRLVRFALVVRDGRGGSDWIERWFCLRP